MSRSNFQELAAKITAKPCAYPVRLIAVDGGAGAGKTTFAGHLSEVLGGVPVIPMDDFIAWDDLTEFWPRMEEQVLGPLFKGQAFRYQKRDWVNDVGGRGLNEWRDVPFSKTILFEGVGAARRAVASRLSYSIWIEAPWETRLKRGIERDGEPVRDIWLGWRDGEKRFIEAEKAFQRADLIVDGTVPYEGDPPRFRVKWESSF